MWAAGVMFGIRTGVGVLNLVELQAGAAGHAGCSSLCRNGGILHASPLSELVWAGLFRISATGQAQRELAGEVFKREFLYQVLKGENANNVIAQHVVCEHHLVMPPDTNDSHFLTSQSHTSCLEAFKAPSRIQYKWKN